jgi:surface protein
MFESASEFNQPLNSWNVSNVTDMTQMFYFTNNFNQDLDSWDVSKVTTMARMFAVARNFNGKISSWNVSAVTDISFMFVFASKFNQNLSNWDVSNKANMEQLFMSALKFNNGELGYTPISGANITLGSSSYTSSPSVLTCPGATLSNGLNISDVVIITTASIVYAAQITGRTDTTLTLSPAYTSNINSGSITSITKQVLGTAPLTWNTSNFTTCLQMFRNCTYFNQRLLAKDGTSPWSMSKVTNVNEMFYGNSANAQLGGITNTNLFNNGYLITDTTHPLGWSFTSTPTSTDWHTNCVLTSGNAASNPAF